MAARRTAIGRYRRRGACSIEESKGQQVSYNFKDFDAQFPDDDACLAFIFKARFAKHVCECGKADCFHRRTKRRAYQCAFCGAQIYPTAGTIFEKSETSLKSWFFAIFLFAKSKNGVAAK